MSAVHAAARALLESAESVKRPGGMAFEPGERAWQLSETVVLWREVTWYLCVTTDLGYVVISDISRDGARRWIKRAGILNCDEPPTGRQLGCGECGHASRHHHLDTYGLGACNLCGCGQYNFRNRKLESGGGE